MTKEKISDSFNNSMLLKALLLHLIEKENKGIIIEIYFSGEFFEDSET
jgi:hypothetical protein